MLKAFLAALVLVGICVFGMCFNIIFRKDGKFPETEISANREMKKLGIRCAKEEELRLWAKNGRKTEKPVCSDDGCEACGSCSLYKKEEK